MPWSVHIRPYLKADLLPVVTLFYHSVHTLCAGHYSKEELNAWAPMPDPDLSRWEARFIKQKTIVAVHDDVLVGFGNWQANLMSIDMLYVHKDFNRMGVGSALLRKLEEGLGVKGVKSSILEASITARPFFENHGYVIVKENRKIRNGVELVNFIMKKELTKKQNG